MKRKSIKRKSIKRRVTRFKKIIEGNKEFLKLLFEFLKIMIIFIKKD